MPDSKLASKVDNPAVVARIELSMDAFLSDLYDYKLNLRTQLQGVLDFSVQPILANHLEAKQPAPYIEKEERDVVWFRYEESFDNDIRSLYKKYHPDTYDELFGEAS